MTKKLSLVKYAESFWVTLVDYTSTRDTEGYSGEASVKSAIRTFVVKNDPDKYIAFRGELQLKNIVQENKGNPLFNAEDFQGTRQALIHVSMLDGLNERFKVNKHYEVEFKKFMGDIQSYMSNELSKKENKEEHTEDTVGARSKILMQLRAELSRVDKEIEVRKNNRDKIMEAINAIQGIELDSM